MTDRRRFAFVEAPSTGVGELAIEAVLALGLEPVLFARTPDSYRFDYPDLKVITVDTNDSEAVAEVAHDLGGVIGIGTAYEFYTVIAAAAAARLGLRGPAPDSVARCRSKLLCRERLSQVAPHLAPPFQQLHTPSSIARALDTIGLPMVVKLSGQAGGGGVVIARTADEARAAATELLAMTEMDGRPLDGVVIAEGFIVGKEYSVETLGTRAVAVTEKRLEGKDGLIETGHSVPAHLSRTEAKLLCETALEGLRAIDLTIGAAHVEVMIAGDRARIVEINGRLAGDRVPELIKYATGFPYVMAWIADLAGLPEPDWTPRAGHAAIGFTRIPQSGEIVRVDGVEGLDALPGIVGAGVLRGPGSQIVLRGNNRDRCAWVLASTESRDATLAAMAEAERRIHCEMR